MMSDHLNNEFISSSTYILVGILKFFLPINYIIYLSQNEL